MDLLLHPKTRVAIEAFMAHPSHALVLVGVEGTGKGTTADYIVQSILGAHASSTGHNQHVLKVSPENGVIPIESVRGIVHFLQLKTQGAQQLRRAVIIEDAHLMRSEAQNALLKTLEEPPADTIIILTTNNPRQLQQTIYSRAQHITILPVSANDAMQFYQQTVHSTDSIIRAHRLSSGAAALLHGLLAESDSGLTQAIADAKSFLSMDSLQRLALVDQLSKDKERIVALLDAITRIARSGISQASSQSQPTSLQRWLRILKSAHDAQSALMVQANAKLLLTRLCQVM